MEKREKRIKPNHKQKNERKKGAAPKLSAFRGPMSFSPVPLIHPILNLLPHIHNNYIYSTILLLLLVVVVVLCPTFML